jgi:subtilisin-like proprotein convertase family protein
VNISWSQTKATVATVIVHNHSHPKELLLIFEHLFTPPKSMNFTMKKALFLLLLLSSLITANAQTFSGGGGTIPDNSPAVFFPITITTLPLTPLDSNFGVEAVCINLLHNNDYQLTIQLVAPDGTLIDLSMNNGGTGNNYTNTCFTGSASTPITSGSAPFTGTFRAQGILGNVNNGQAGNGTWYLKVKDNNFGTTGSLTSWNITFSNTPAYPFVFASSNLPIVVLNTNGQTIVDDPKIVVHMGIIDNGAGVRNYLNNPFNDYDGNIAIEIRGSWSQTFPQKQYGFETLDSLNVEADKVVMGMPAESDWILYAPYNDKSCMRNVLSYDIANKTGHYASRTRFCELVINNEYKGIYVMEEKIKRNVNRVDISKLVTADTTGNDLTGGYIIKIDKPIGGSTPGWYSDFNGVPGTPIRFQYEYPSSTNIVIQQKTYIQAYVDSFEHALNATWFANPDSGYKKFIDVASFIDYFILNETSKNVDAYRNSTFLYKKKITSGGKLYIGPAWDYNIAFWNADYCQGNLYTGWQYLFNNVCGASGDNNVPFWWTKFLQDPAYTAQLRCRWEQLRLTVLQTDTLMDEIDAMALLLDEAKDRHFTKYPIMGTAVWANPSPVATSYAGEISNMKAWLQQRLVWLDANIPGTCTLSSVAGEVAGIESISVYPNPFNENFNVQFNLHKPGSVNFEMFDLSGRKIYEKSADFTLAGMNEIQIANTNLTPGVYLLKVKTADANFVMKIVGK